eukprot:CAMPEP_0178481756 /NCGR_PEP_ID=MMETSP0696-20121128/6379_1 /TAXON_ID=265572 /ORGANISM="Extubocellulus spinifer, Strain CCMP396" /LENGTH=1859 /DNA_ID=CAMNT_0020109245 /DNA_START=170 /DNA_END=5749 /DNA_ORIENTATION=+
MNNQDGDAAASASSAAAGGDATDAVASFAVSSSLSPAGATTTTGNSLSLGSQLSSSTELQSSHHKRLAQILRYLATMHRGGGGGSGNTTTTNTSSVNCFVKEYRSVNEAREALTAEYFVDDVTGAGGDDIGDSSILFSLQDFKTIPSSSASAGGDAGSPPLFPSPPFSFYAAADSTGGGGGGGGGGRSASGRKSRGKNSGVSVSWEPAAAAGGRGSKEQSRGKWKMSAWSSSASGSGSNKPPIPSCWLRLTRIRAEEPPPVNSSVVRAYLEAWAAKKKVRSYKRLIRDLDSLNHAPALDPATASAGRQREIKTFLRKCKRHVRRDMVRRKLEPMYNRLFEMAQRTKSADMSYDELILGLGSARMVLDDDDDDDDDGGGGTSTVVNGPLLEVRVEVELAPDGALLVRPCEHTGVELNRAVLGAIVADRDVLSRLHRSVAEMETQTISPGQPGTYASMLKRIAVEVSSGGRFVSTMSPAYATLNAGRGSNKLLVTDSWCFYHRPKPSSVWARDAQALADLISRQQAATSGRSIVSPALSPPLASISLTHGPNTLAGMSLIKPSISHRFASSFKSLLGLSTTPQYERPLFPLPSSASQERIHRLLADGAPAVVVEGPPGCGKTHSIANIVCSFLAQGKRVLVTSKGGPALAVLRQRLPECMQELCVDVTVSEAAGMQQLQQTVERLADRVSRGIDKTELCISLANNIKTLEADIAATDVKLESFHKRKCALLQTPNGQELAEMAYSVLDEAPWLASTTSQWEDTKFMDFVEAVEAVADEIHAYHDVTGYDSPPSSTVLAAVAEAAGGIVPSITGKTVQAVSSLPLIGSFSGALSYQGQKEAELSQIELFGTAPTHKSEWTVVKQALERNKRHWLLFERTIAPLIEKENWPRDAVYDTSKDRLCFSDSFITTLRKARHVRKMQAKLLRPCDYDHPIQSQHLEVQRAKMVKRLQELDEKLVEAKVITQMSSMFSPEAQSALIKFAQLAGKAKFKSNAQASRLTARQQRHRQAYLDAFRACVGCIPAWFCTSNQVNDYLPAEFGGSSGVGTSGLFDLCIIDEASQSDITALPSMLRGKQWLVVGDGKQVSPTESFTAESHIESLRALLPESPFRECFLPGHSFFDLCSQAFPVGRVVLSEHFRCSPDIIKFSNDTYYQSRLHPLRLPTSAEVMSPSLVDIYLRNGRKVGKTNEAEANKIVSMIKTMVDGESRKKRKRRSRPKSIGVICLVGDEQARMIRGRLLDSIGPEKYSEHDVLVGEPPSFQGSERDVIFLSMVSSPGSVATQSQLMYHQRINVALSRARDRMVLVRSINRSHITSIEDAKVAVIDFFSEFASKDVEQDNPKRVEDSIRLNSTSYDAPPLQERVLDHVTEYLDEAGFVVRPMGLVWAGAICIENDSTGARAAVAIESSGEVKQEWTATVAQQRAIERVGWQCFRLDALSWILDHKSTSDMLHAFLRSANVKPKKQAAAPIALEDEAIGSEAEQGEHADGGPGDDEDDQESAAEEAQRNNDLPEDVVVISSNDEEENMAGEGFMHVSSGESSAAVKDEDDDDDDDDGFDPSNYGSVIQLGGFANAPASSNQQNDDDAMDDDSISDLDTKPRAKPRRRRDKAEESEEEVEEEDMEENDDIDDDSFIASESESISDPDTKPRAARKRTRSARSTSSAHQASDEDYHGDESDESDEDDESESRKRKRKRRRRRRLDKHSRDGRWYPSHEPDRGDDEKMDAEDEAWDDLKDVVSSDSSYQDDDGSILSRLRSSAQTVQRENNEQPNEDAEVVNADMPDTVDINEDDIHANHQEGGNQNHIFTKKEEDERMLDVDTYDASTVEKALTDDDQKPAMISDAKHDSCEDGASDRKDIISLL